MRAVYVRAFAPFETVGIEEVPDPQPGPGEVVVDVVAAEVNYPDILVIGGQYQIEYNTDLTTTNWIPLTTIMLPSSPYLYVDTNSPAVANRFYRAVGLQ